LADLPKNSVLLKSKTQEIRIQRRHLLHFFELLGVYLQVGYELSYAWNQVLIVTGRAGEIFVLEELQFDSDTQPFSSFLEKLSQNFSQRSYRVFFEVLGQLYTEGAPLVPAMQSLSQFLRRELERDLEQHLRQAPSQANILLLLFFLPAAFLLLFFPFILHLQASLQIP
jgi:hypothetical protein